MITNLIRRLRGHRGDADPILTIGAMMATLIVSASIIGAIVALLAIGQKYTNDQVNATSLTTARDAFASDAQNTTAVAASAATTVTFTQNPAGSAITFDRGTTGKTCRVSQWTSVKDPAPATTATLTDTVWQTAWDNTNRVCAAPTGSGSHVLSVTGFSGQPAITYANAAGAPITFTAVGVGSTTARPAGSYYDPAEWASTTPKTITVTGLLTSQASGTKTNTLLGVTHLAETHGLLAAGGSEPKPVLGTYNPVAPTIISVTRSGTVGNIYAGYREGIHVVWGASYCGPYSVKYDVSLSSPTAYVNPQTFTVTPTYATQSTHDFAAVPNGAIVNVTVKATCPAAVSTTTATSAPYTYTQPLPAPGLWNTVLTPTVHQLHWSTGLSSLPVSYLPWAKHSTQATYGQAWWVGGNSFNWGWPAGYTYGVSNYMLTAGVTGGATALSNRSDATVAWPGIPATGVWHGDSGGAIYDNTVYWNAIGCPAGTSPHYNPVVSGNGQGWRVAYSDRVWVNYATWYSAYVQTQCLSPFEGSPVTNSGTTWWHTNNPPPPVPSAPWVSGSYTRAATGGGGSSISFGSSSYATSYEFGTDLVTSNYQSGWSDDTSSSSGTYTGASLCGIPDTIIGGAARVRAGGQSGWSGWNTSSLKLIGGRFACN